MNIYHGGTLVSPYDQHAYIDNVVVATSYIGPWPEPPTYPDEVERPDPVPDVPPDAATDASGPDAAADPEPDDGSRGCGCVLARQDACPVPDPRRDGVRADPPSPAGLSLAGSGDWS